MRRYKDCKHIIWIELTLLPHSKMTHYEEAETFINKYKEVLDLMSDEWKKRWFKFFWYMYVRCNDSISETNSYERYTSQWPLHLYDAAMIKHAVDDILELE